MQRLLSFLIILLSILISACATQVTSVKDDESKQLLNNKGFVLLGIQTNQDLFSIEISGSTKIQLTPKDLKRGTNYLLVDLEAGIYTIERLRLDQYWYVSFKDDTTWDFEITPGKINYVGHLEIVKKGYWRPVTYTELVNRSSEALQFLEKKYPKILTNHLVNYGGPGEDDFFNFISTLGNRLSK